MFDLFTLIALSLQGAILGLLVVAIRRRNVAAAVNALAALALAMLPVILEIGFRLVLAGQVVRDPWLALWISIAGFLHSLGMLGPYDSTWWWDHLTHTVSAALVAALLYAALIVAPLLETTQWPGTVAGLTVVFTFAIGVFWELIELVARDVANRLDVEPMLVHYGWRDTAMDLVFDVVGALVIVAFDVRIFVSIVEQFPVTTERVLVASGWIVVLGSIAMVLFVGIGRSIQS